jgi:DNA-binding NarL/FixJ family response regulator
MKNQIESVSDTDKIPNPASASQAQKRRPRVFVVDDALVVRNLVIECIEEVGGLEVAGFAGSEASALSWLRSHACDVLILDLELRQGTGLGLLKTLASLEPAPKLMTIVFSNHADETSRRIAMQLGAAYFFDKTSDADKLRPLLQDISAANADR